MPIILMKIIMSHLRDNEILREINSMLGLYWALPLSPKVWQEEHCGFGWGPYANASACLEGICDSFVLT